MPAFNRKSLQKVFYWIRVVKTWQLVLILLVGIFFSASFLRLNSLRMDSLRRDVISADKSGDKEKIKASLVALQQYVSSHMNTSLNSGVYLPEEFARAQEAAYASAASATNPNASVYQQASIDCRSRFQGTVASYRNDYVACVAERVQALGAGLDPSELVREPKKEDYQYNFISPVWSADLAGWSVLFCVVITSVILLRLISELIVRQLLKHRFKTV